MANQADKDEWVRRVLGATLDPSTDTRTEAVSAALETWAKRRADVIVTLKSLETAIRDMKDPLGDQAIILVKAIAANLTAVPDTKNSVADLRRYIDTDSIIDDAEQPNGFGIDVKIRAPLAGALTALETALAA
jgi:hypothetical protein